MAVSQCDEREEPLAALGNVIALTVDGDIGPVEEVDHGAGLPLVRDCEAQRVVIHHQPPRGEEISPLKILPHRHHLVTTQFRGLTTQFASSLQLRASAAAMPNLRKNSSTAPVASPMSTK